MLYREERAQERAKQRQAQQIAVQPVAAVVNVTENGVARPLDLARITALVHTACEGLGRDVSAQPILDAMQRDLYDGVPMEEVRKSLILAARG